MTTLYRIANLEKRHNADRGYRLLIRNLNIGFGAKIAITGPSGCGKSTSLDMLGLSMAPDHADEFIFSPAPGQAGHNITGYWQKRDFNGLAALRLANMGYVLQAGELFPFLTVGENLCLAGRLDKNKRDTVFKNAKNLAEKLGIAHLWNAAPDTLSVGERQRVAIGRALAGTPPIILADEPTAALDPIHAQNVMAAFMHCVNEFGSALIVVTHDSDWAHSGGITQIPFQLKKTGAGVTAILDDMNAVLPKAPASAPTGRRSGE